MILRFRHIVQKFPQIQQFISQNNARKATAPSRKLNLAIIAAGGQGKHNTRAALGLSDVQVSAICDVTEETDYSRFYYKTYSNLWEIRKAVLAHRAVL